MLHQVRVLLVVLTVLWLPLSGQAVDQALIDKAIERGVAALRNFQSREKGIWVFSDVGQGGSMTTGATALAGLTLLECRVPADDPAVVAAAQHVRKEAPELTHTYPLGLAILFLDRLGDASDVPLIQSMGVRLLAGQGSSGAWGYSCPPVSDAEVRRLTDLVKQRSELKTGKPATVKPGGLPPEIKQQVGGLQPIKPALGQESRVDNSNTQFAIMGLWVAQRHGLPVTDAFLRLDGYFRGSQNGDGGWSYYSVGQGVVQFSSPAMTCSGILGIAVAHGAVNDPERKGTKTDPSKDLVLQKALLGLGTALGAPTVGMPPGGRGSSPVPMSNGKMYYFLWSVERVAVALGLSTIGKKDWYNWGAEILLATQRQDGSWHGEYGISGVDTCFALLFLRRANLTSDLTGRLGNKMRDPGQAVLRVGGVGGAGLNKTPAIRSGLEPEDKTSPSGSGRVEPTRPSTSGSEQSKAEKLSQAFVGAFGSEQTRLLKELQESKGADYTDALSLSIPRLQGEIKQQARDALALRFTRLKVDSLRAYLGDNNAEIRRAAVLASAMRDLREQIPSLIERLNDSDPIVVRATYAALRTMTGQSFDPGPEASREEHDKAVESWKNWWKQSGGSGK